MFYLEQMSLSAQCRIRQSKIIPWALNIQADGNSIKAIPHEVHCTQVGIIETGMKFIDRHSKLSAFNSSIIDVKKETWLGSGDDLRDRLAVNVR